VGQIAVAIVNYNTREHLGACLATVVAERPREVIVVDNGSSDGSVAMVRERYPSVNLAANANNLGYGSAANQAMRLSSADYVLLLNSDTRLQPGALQSLSCYLDHHPRVAIVGPRITNPDGALQPSCYPFPSPLYLFLEESALGQFLRHVPIVRDHYPRTWSHDHRRPAPSVLGAALALRREALDAVAGFDESYFMYFEEIDLCYRLQRAAWEVHFAPVTCVTHSEGASTAQRRTEMRLHWFDSIARFYRQHYSAARQIQLIILLKAIALARLTRDGVWYRITRDTDTRARLGADLPAWRRVLTSRL
jgi:GT2 family glycosyltransferase